MCHPPRRGSSPRMLGSILPPTDGRILVAADRGQRSIVWLGDRAEVCTNDVVDRARDSSGRPAIIADQVALTRNHPIPIRIDLPVRRTQDRIPVDHMAAVDICSIVWRMAAPDSARARFGKTIPLRVATVCHWPKNLHTFTHRRYLNPIWRRPPYTKRGLQAQNLCPECRQISCPIGDRPCALTLRIAHRGNLLSCRQLQQRHLHRLQLREQRFPGSPSYTPIVISFKFSRLCQPARQRPALGRAPIVLTEGPRTSRTLPASAASSSCGASSGGARPSSTVATASTSRLSLTPIWSREQSAAYA